MGKKGEKVSHSAVDSTPPANAGEFAAGLKRRRQAAHGLQQDLLTEVPLLYGSPDSLAPHGDAGVVLAQAHRREMLRRNGGGVLNASSKRSDVALPFEGTVTAVAIVLFLFFLFGE